MTFEETVEAISALAPRGWRLGLDRMQKLVEVAGLTDALGGSSDQSPKYIQVAGTNGKGTTTAFLQAIFLLQGYRTGGFFSPFVYDLRERVQLGGEMISKDTFARLGAELLNVAEQMEGTEFEGVTEFELKTALGFAAFKDYSCEWVALEVGLGGRLDATTVATPEVGVITTIGWDHMAILGDTLELIAYEKAGIIKPGMPVVVGLMEPGPLEVIRRVAEEKEAQVYCLGQEIAIRETDAGRELSLNNWVLTIPGADDARAKFFENMALAIFAALLGGAIDPVPSFEDLKPFLRLPGRFEQRTIGSKNLILDGAHNGDAARVLAQDLMKSYPGEKFRFVFSMVQGHECSPILEHLAPLASEFHVCPVDFHRAKPVEEIAVAVSSETGVPVYSYSNSVEAMKAVLNDDLQERIVITGSFYLVGECGRALKSFEQGIGS